jgi:hypothetical protein
MPETRSNDARKFICSFASGGGFRMRRSNQMARVSQEDSNDAYTTT